jgi:hypothetical protein
MRVFLGAFACFFLLLACGCTDEVKTNPKNVSQEVIKGHGARTPDNQNVTGRGD